MTEPVARISAKTASTGVGLLFACVSFLTCAVQGDAPGRCVMKALLCGVICSLAVSVFLVLWKKTVDSLPNDR